ncbi:hypothetical protein AZE42_04224 [Rhizopogon vesiculosus]|uniref:carbonic anhydrase n=1 Tax=Rhizopogon vesiculosus TaxID=180088 RepID=A0A1J8R1C0_9AGAM|nr:hypothetical protein AZE42_04224 [Rhizopogon vesiculosus]
MFKEPQSPNGQYSVDSRPGSSAPTIDVSLGSPTFDYASLNAPLWPHRLSASFSAMADQIAAASQALALVPSTAFSGNDMAAEFASLKSKLSSIENTQERLAAEFAALKEQFTELNTDKGPALEELDKKIEALKKIVELDQQRLPARLNNSRATILKTQLKAPVGADGKPPAGFPATRGEFEHITKERYEAILKAYGLPIKGDTDAKREALLQVVAPPLHSLTYTASVHANLQLATLSSRYKHILRAVFLRGPPTISHLSFTRSMSQNSTELLLNANQQWAQSVIQDRPEFFAQSATGQSPKILWIGCSDSRVPESVITASKPGDIFVHRNIANQFHLNDDSALSVLTYAIKVVGVEHGEFLTCSTDKPLILYLTAACLQAAKDADTAASTSTPQPETPLTRWLNPLTKLVQSLDLSACSASEALNKVVEANIIMQVENLCKAEPITAAWADPNAKQVTVHGWVYDLAEGRIKELVSRDAPL